MSRTLILGGGFGGIATAVELRRRAPENEVVLVDASDGFAMGLRKLWELSGIGTIAEGTRNRFALERHGIRFVHDRIQAIDPDNRSAIVGAKRWDGDRLVVALGAVQRPDLIPGLAENAYDAWNKGSVPALRRTLEAFKSGRILIVVAGAPYPCPPAPYECAMLLDDYLRREGRRDDIELGAVTLQPILMPNAGRAGSQYVAEQLAERSINFSTSRRLLSVDAGLARFEDGEEAFDLLIAVPPHSVPAVVADAGLTGASGWIEVDRDTLATGRPGVYAVGDATLIKLANGLPLPKAGAIAEAEGLSVAAAIAAELEGKPAPPPFTGRGVCFVETGRDSAALVDGDFFAEPEPDVRLRPANADHAAAKRRFESERLSDWFGS